MTVSRTLLRRLAALFTAVLLLLTPPVPAQAAGAEKAVPWGEMAYEHYDPASFYKDLEELTAAGSAGDEKAVLTLYDRLYDEYLQVYTLDAISYIRNSQDVTDKYWADELVYNQTLDTELSDALCTACHQVMEGPCADAFAAHVGQLPAREFKTYEPMTARELELTGREAELVNEYTALMGRKDEALYAYGGQNWNLSKLNGADGAALSYGAYYDILHGIYDVLARQAGPIYLELVSIRTEIARLNGYVDYNHYAYREIYSRSYTPEQTQALFSEIQAVSQKLYTSSVRSMKGTVAPAYAAQEEMLAILKKYAGRIDPVFSEAWQFMTDNQLYDIAAGAGRATGAYTIDLPAYGSQFVYSDDTGSCSAMSALFHEFGHFTAGYIAPAENFLTSRSILDLAEIHSTGLELLVLPYYGAIYDQGADIARYCVLSDALATATDQALFAEFEARVYEDPDMTVEELGMLYNEISTHYGYADIGRPDQSWISVPHFFMNPDYIVSYVAAALAALQIWTVSQRDHQAAVDIYMNILRQGQFDLDYFQVLENAGLQGFDTAGMATDVCSRTWDALTAMEAAILG